ncbi:hypothetical protein N7457_008257 [Penicillium paradoxum]|uniref:uncharacterized protein n=1 Tax=Penicillium paradoxum TaxID=176176 RepID=UPI0025466934|nr:uncharacterized protein N7457_008257 [Penicillium paradoxum]KAJ5773361.1 hypothetical protein N7457_008257 [Penicillium paradoxum]
MPDILIVNDSASFASSDTFSTQDSAEQPRVQLRRRSTVVQLTRKVSKRISKTILRGGAHENELSESNLRDLDSAPYLDLHSPRSPKRYIHEAKRQEAIYEAVEEECPPVDVEAVREMRLHESYAVFCQNFTLSGGNRMSRRFDLSMGTERAEEDAQPSHGDQIPQHLDKFEFPSSHAHPEHITVDARPRANPVELPISPSTVLDNTPISQSIITENSCPEWSDPNTPKVEEDLLTHHSSFEITHNSNYPQAPPRIITPTVWMDMQREERERKEARHQRFLNPFRSWFMTTQPSWGRRYETVE